MTNLAVTNQAQLGLTRATSIRDAHRTLEPRPLVRPEELKAFYQSEVNIIRGTTCVDRMALGLNRAWQSVYYKALLMGHPGVGKSTELTQLLNQDLVGSRFCPIRLSVTGHLDPVSFKPFDVLLIMMDEVARATARPKSDGGAGVSPSEILLRRVWDWFAEERSTTEQATTITAEAEAGAGPAAESMLAKVLGLFARLRGEMKFASARRKEFVEYRLSRLSPFVEAANALLGECNQLLRQASQRDWLFVIDDFDKSGVSPEAAKDLFVTYANMLTGLECHYIFTLPIELGCSSSQLPVTQDKIFCIPDMMVYRRDHSDHVEA